MHFGPPPQTPQSTRRRSKLPQPLLAALLLLLLGLGLSALVWLAPWLDMQLAPWLDRVGELPPGSAAVGLGVVLSLAAALLAGLRLRGARRAEAALRQQQAELEQQFEASQASLALLGQRATESAEAAEQQVNEQAVQLQLQAARLDGLQSRLLMLVLDAQGLVHDISPRLAALFGRPAEALRGAPPPFAGSRALTPERWVQAWAAVQDGQAWQGQLAFVPAGGGASVWLELQAGPLQDEGDGRARCLLLATDISAMLRQRKEVSEALERLTEVLDGQHAGGWTWDRVHERVRLDRRALALLGLPAGGPVDMDWEQLAERFHPDDLPGWRMALGRHLAGRDAVLQLTLRLRAATGWRWAQLRGGIVKRTPAGEAMRLAGSLIDIDQQQAEAAQAAAQQRLDTQVQRQAGVGGFEWEPLLDRWCWNEAALQMQQLASGTVLTQQQAVQAFEAEDREGLLQALGGLQQQGGAVQLELRLRTALGAPRWVRLHAEAEPAALRLQGWLQDIGAEREAQQQARRERQLLQGLIEAQPCGLLWLDAQARPRLFNAALPRLLGPLPAQLESAATPWPRLAQLAAFPLPEQFDCEGDEGRALQLHCQPAPEGGLLVLVLDASELVAARQQAWTLATALHSVEQQQQQASRELAAGRQRLSELGAAISGPSTALLARLRDAADRAPDAAQRVSLSLAVAEAGRLQQLPAELEDAAGAASGQLQLRPQTFVLDELLSELAVLWAARRGARPLELVFALAPELPGSLLGDSTRIKQLLMQLAGPVLDRAEAGELLLSVQRLPAPAGGKAALRFALGFTPQEGRRPLSDLESGLEPCRQLLRLMGSELTGTGRSGADGGFAFTLELPVVAGPAAAPLTLQRVLLVEPRPSSRAALQSLLQAQGAQVLAVGDAAQAGQAIANEPRFDLLWLATQLPEGEGGACGPDLRQQHLARHGGRPLRWLLCGSAADAAQQPAADAYALKPLSAGKVREALAGGLVSPSAPEGSAAAQPMRVPVAQQQRALALGLDLQAGLDRFLGRSALYLRTASVFAAQAQRLGDQLRLLMARRPPDLAAAQDLLHSFKSLAATLAFERLAHWGRVGEQRLRSGQALDDEWLDSLELQLAEGLAMLLSEAQALHQPPAPEAPVAIAAPTPLAALQRGVEAGDPGVLKLLAEHRQSLAPWLGDDLEALDRALLAQDFVAARSLLAARQGLAVT